MPPRTTRYSDRPRVSDRTVVAKIMLLEVRGCSAIATSNRMRNVLKETTKILACSLYDSGRELDVRKKLLSLRKEKCFFLTSPLYRTPSE
jgi:hypothetical protein